MKYYLLPIFLLFTGCATIEYHTIDLQSKPILGTGGLVLSSVNLDGIIYPIYEFCDIKDGCGLPNGATCQLIGAITATSSWSSDFDTDVVNRAIEYGGNVLVLVSQQQIYDYGAMKRAENDAIAQSGHTTINVNFPEYIGNAPAIGGYQRYSVQQSTYQPKLSNILSYQPENNAVYAVYNCWMENL